MPQFQLVSEFEPRGDQPHAIEELVEGVHAGVKQQILLGATGTGKTFSVSRVIEQLQRPTLVLAHNKTLAAQLYAEFKEFFPRNAVEYYVSYYDYYQPESYVPRHDLYIEKQTSINDQIERLRIASKAALVSRRDVLIVASVSCIYGTGDPTTWAQTTLTASVGENVRRERMLRELVRLQYKRNDMVLEHGTFRARGDTLEVFPIYANTAYRISLFDEEIERIVEFDPFTGEVITQHESIVFFPSTQFVADQEKLQKAMHDIDKELEGQMSKFQAEGKLLEAQRIEQRTQYDLEMLREMGFCGGIENYSRHLEQRPAGSPPHTLVDYFPDDYLLVIDESHMTIPQLNGMYNGDRTRKTTLVDFGFRLPSAVDNRPLKFTEFEDRMGMTIYMTATPGPYEREHAGKVVQQIIRPTGVVDPQISVRPVKGQIDDLLQEVALRVKRGQRAFITTLTQRMAEELAGYLNETGIKAHHLHAEINTLERIEILRDLRLGIYDAVVGINLLREGIDMPEVSLVAILDADKEGFLRSGTALIQIVGRAARHVEGQVIMYADRVTDSMQRAIDETDRRREIQEKHNEAHGIVPQTIVKGIRDLTDRVKSMVGDQQQPEHPEEAGAFNAALLSKGELHEMAREIETEMKAAAKALEFEKAAMLRDQMIELKGFLAESAPAEAELITPEG
jgi:excinuclease ABC subunit B